MKYICIQVTCYARVTDEDAKNYQVNEPEAIEAVCVSENEVEVTVSDTPQEGAKYLNWMHDEVDEK